MLKKMNDLYNKYEEGLLSSNQLSKLVVECIYLEPHKFGIANMEQDYKNDFMVYLLQKMEYFISKYSKSISVFSTYICAITHNLRITWFREFYHSVAHSESVKYYIESEEKTYELAEHEYPYIEQKEKKEYTNLSKREIITILVLALKSFYYLQDSHIEHISNITGIPIEKIEELIHKIKLTADKKCLKQTKELQKVNNSYIKMNRFRIELMHVDTNSSLAKHFEKSHLFYTKKWKDTLKRYNTAPPLKPSNAQIGKILQIKEYKVYQILRECKEREEKGIPIIPWKNKSYFEKKTIDLS